jgi:hypothetical protein
MSLSPDDFKNAIDIASIGEGSVLVYVDRLIGQYPVGCDGWSIEERDGCLYSTHDDQFFPPRYTGPDQIPHYSEEVSRRLAQEVQQIRCAKHDPFTTTEDAESAEKNQC